MTQQEEAMTAPRPAANPNAASHLGAVGEAAGDEAFSVVSSVALSMVMVAHPVAATGAREIIAHVQAAIDNWKACVGGGR